jgi:hypothetical protein
MLRIYEANIMRGEDTTGWIKLHNMKFIAHSSTLHELRIVRKRWAEQVTCMEEMSEFQNTAEKRTTLDTNVNWHHQTVILSALISKFLFKLQHVSSGAVYHQEEILEHTEGTTVQMLKHNSIGNIISWVFVIPLT